LIQRKNSICAIFYIRFEKQKVDKKQNYDTIEEFNVDSKAEYSALYSTGSQKQNIKKNKLKQTNASAPFIHYRLRSVKAVWKENT